MGRGRKAQGSAGGGAWEAVRAEATSWPGVTVLRRFGRDGLILRLALRETGILPHPRFARTGWIVLRLRGASGRSLARRWLARAYAAARDVPPETA
jgi:hypothetical protein